MVVLGLVIAFLRNRRLFSQHREIAADARAIARELKGEVFRDVEDLVISGSASGLRVVVRFGYGENTPGVNIRMDAPANFQMSLASRGKEQLAGKYKVATNDPSFDARFSVRSDDPKQAEMFLGSTVTRAEIGALCCSSMAFVTISKAVLEQSELVIPQTPGRHIINHIRSMQKLAEKLRAMPFAERVVLTPVVRERKLLLRTSILVGVIVTAVALYSAMSASKQPRAPEATAEAAAPEGISQTDADLIPSLQDWKPASEADFDPDAVSWLKSTGTTAAPRVPGDYSGQNSNLDAVYLLKSGEGQRRLVIISKRKLVFDTKYPYLGILARVPKENLQKVDWASRKPEPPDGDGIIITRTPHDLSSGLIMYFSEGRLVTGVPRNYQLVDIAP